MQNGTFEAACGRLMAHCHGSGLPRCADPK
jgi:hypothetical protein